jgi:hypothetical protein
VIVLAASSSARAEPATCTPTGAVLFELDVEPRPDSDIDASKIRASQLKLYGNGAWTYDAAPDARGRPRATSGCADAAVVKRVTAAAAHATWKTTHSSITCRGYSPSQTAYAIRGKRVFVETMCSADGPDDATAKALEQLRDVADDLLASAPPLHR